MADQYLEYIENSKTKASRKQTTQQQQQQKVALQLNGVYKKVKKVVFCLFICLSVFSILINQGNANQNSEISS